ncbi:hypothetical protein TTHT_1053 [Thermotomaculum hydrothermale]|uniref:FecR protein domain-containing protein n=1 Tax=Thermotomaculum hydrothermale TaxID=981385 RepID=A0A7R6PQP5_9BACT|nr:FecR family protein [Thermotomaculum hydrothermale]BBB32591.1 hypothetical protein TTHT_1053 [Thermotomaculum hydrothermale]
MYKSFFYGGLNDFFKFKRFILIFLLSFLLSFSFLYAENWQKCTVFPGSKKIATFTAQFPECWERNIYNYNEFINCNNSKDRVSWEQVSKKISRTYEFSLPSKQYVTFNFESKIPENVFYHQAPSFEVSHLGRDNKWHKVITYAYYKHTQGNKVKSESSKFSYQVKPDGTLKYLIDPFLYEAGRYKVVIYAGKRTGSYDLCFVPGSAKLDVYSFSPGGTVSQGVAVSGGNTAGNSQRYTKKIGYIQVIIGNASVVDKNTGQKLKAHDPIYEGQELNVDGGFAKIIFTDYHADTAVIMLRPNTRIKFNKPKPKDNSFSHRVYMFFGGLFFKNLTGKSHSFHIECENAIVGVEGTQFEAIYDPSTEALTVSVIKGRVKMVCKENPEYVINVCEGQRGMMYAGCNRALRLLSNNELAKLKSTYSLPAQPQNNYGDNTYTQNPSNKMVREVTASLKGLFWEMPCNGGFDGAGYNALYQHPVKSAVLGGDPNSLYEVTLRFLGVVEQESYAGGKKDGMWYIGGYPTDRYYNIYKLEISAPHQVYYLNAGQAGIPKCFKINYTKTIQVRGGAKVILSADAQDGKLIGNNDKLIVPGVTVVSQPFDGQFIQMYVLNVRKIR